MLPITTILSFAKSAASAISSKVWIIAGTLLVAALGWWYVSSLHGTIDKQIRSIATLEATNNVLKDQNKTLQVSYDTIKLSLDAQNDFIQRLGINFEFLSKDMTILSNEVNNKFGKLSKDLNKFVSTDMSALTCDQAIEEMRKHAMGK